MGLFPKYLLIYFFLNAVYSEHSRIQWNSSSKIEQCLHFLSWKGIAMGLFHLPVSFSSLCEETLRRDKAILNLSILIHFKYFCNLKSANNKYERALVELCSSENQFWTKTSLALCLITLINISTFPTPCNNQTSLNPNDCKISLTPVTHGFFVWSYISLTVQ